MTAYMIFLREGPIHDAHAMEEYQRKNRENIPNFPVKPKPLVAYGAMEGVEGSAPDGVVMLEFDSVEDAKTWYNSDAYQEALPGRLKAADYRAFIVEGLPQG